MADTLNVAKQIGRIFALSAALSISGSANANMVIPGPPTLEHELMLVLVGAVLGGFLGPILMLIDGWIGISPGVKQQKANYAVQRDIAANLRTLVTLQANNKSKPSEQLAPPGNSSIQEDQGGTRRMKRNDGNLIAFGFVMGAVSAGVLGAVIG
jgi:hypothetical protein